MIKHKLFNKQQLGKSMVEMLGVLFIVGILSVGGIAGYIKASHQLRINKLKDDISHLVANTRTLFFTQENYKDLDTFSLIKTGIIPGHMIGANGTLVNRSNGSIYIKSAKSALNEHGAFIVIFNGLSAPMCISLISDTWGSDIQTGFIGITIKGDGDLTIETSNLTEAQFATQNKTFNAIDMPKINISKAHELCNCGYSDTCAIAWKYI